MAPYAVAVRMISGAPLPPPVAALVRMADCLTPMEIIDLLLDPLLPEKRARAAGHLSGCDKCREVVPARRADHQPIGGIRRTDREKETAGQAETTE